MAFHIVHVHHERMETHSHAGRLELKLGWGAEAEPTQWPVATPPWTRAPLSLARWWSSGTDLWLMGISSGKPNQTAGCESWWPVTGIGVVISPRGCGEMCVFLVKEGKGGLSPWKLRPALLQITWLACFVQSVVGLRCFYLGEYHMFQQGQEALCPERIHISNDRWIFSPIIHNHSWGSDLTGK